MAAVGSVLVMLCLFCGAFSQSDVETNFANVLSSWDSDQQVDAFSELPQQMSDNPIDWSNSGIVIGDVTEDDDDVINLELAKDELVGGCSHGDCKFCKDIKIKRFKLNACFEAKLLKLGFYMEVTANNHVILKEEISAKNPPPVCANLPFVGKACAEVYDVDLKNKSGCVRVLFEVKIGPFKKNIKLKIECFKFKGENETRLSFIQLVQQLANKQTNNIL